MKLQIKELKNNKSEVFEEEMSPEDLDIDIGVMHFPEAIKVRAEAMKSANDLTVQMHLEGPCELTCSLCLEEFNNLFEKDFVLHYDIKGLETVTLDPDIRDEIILENPIRILCKPDCRGLCPFCGANLNDEDCGCKDDS